MYDETKNTLYLGLIGLFQFLPSLLLMLVTGSVADRYNRRAIVAACLFVGGLCTAVLLALTVTHQFTPWLVFAILIVFGIERAFMGPAVQSLAPNLVSEEALPNAVAWNSSSWQTASILGPVAGGLLYGVSAVAAYSVSLFFMLGAALLVISIPKPAQRSSSKAVGWETITAGFGSSGARRWCWVRSRSISLPYCWAVRWRSCLSLRETFLISALGIGSASLGSRIGAIAVALFLAAYPIRHRAGVAMFVGVALFGSARSFSAFRTRSGCRLQR